MTFIPLRGRERGKGGVRTSRDSLPRPWLSPEDPCPPLALISCLLSLLQLLQGCRKALLRPVQLLLYQLNAAVQGGHICLGLRVKGERSDREIGFVYLG